MTYIDEVMEKFEQLFFVKSGEIEVEEYCRVAVFIHTALKKLTWKLSAQHEKEIEEIKALVNKWDAAELDSSTLVDEAQRGQEAWKACQAVTGRIE